MGIFRHNQGSINAITQSQSGKYYITPNRRNLTAGPAWSRAGNNIQLDVVVDLNESGGHDESGGNVETVYNLGKSDIIDFTPRNNEVPELTELTFKGMDFSDGGATELYDNDGVGTYQDTFGNVTRVMMGVSVYKTASTLARALWSISQAIWREGFYHQHSNGTSTWIFDGDDAAASITAYAGVNETTEVQINGFYHDGVSVVTQWQNGIVVHMEDDSTAMPAAADLNQTDFVLGAKGNGTDSFDGNLMALGVDNNAALTLAQCYAKIRALHDKYRPGAAQRADVLYIFGQSNAAGAETNASPLDFAAGVGLYKKDEESSGTPLGRFGIFDRSGYGHSTAEIGESAPGIWFADEWKSLTGRNSLYHTTAFSSLGLEPDLFTDTHYWAPKNAVGDAAGQTSMMETRKAALERMRDLSKYSPEVNITRKIAFIVEGERDAQAINAAEPAASQANFEAYANDWLDDIRELYEVDTFAIVNIGRNGQNQTEVDDNAAGVTAVRTAWQNVAAGRADTYLVYEHLNNTTFVLDNLVVDGDGYWVSGQANDADGVHYTTEQYEAIGRTAAYNLWIALGSP